MLKKLHKYLINAFIGPLIITFFLSIFLLLMQFLWKYIDDLVGKGLEWNVIGELLLYASVTLVPMGLPLAILLASIMTFGNMGESHELFAIKSSGISLYRIMKPLVILVIFISIGAFYFSNNLLPFTNLKMQTLLHDVQHQNPEISIQEGIFTNSIEGLSIKVDEKDKKTNELKHVLVYDHRVKQKPASIIIAESGEIKMTSDKSYMIMKLRNGKLYDEVTKNEPRTKRSYPYQKTSFKEQTIYIKMDGLGLKRSDETLFKDNYQMLSINQLNQAIDSLSYDVVRRKHVIGTNILKYSLFKGLRGHNQQNSLVEHTRTTTKTKSDGTKDTVIKTFKTPFGSDLIINHKKNQNKVENDTVKKTANKEKNKQEKTQKNDKAKSKKNKDKYTTQFPFLYFDSIPKEEVTIIDLDSLFNSNSVIEKNKALNVALNYSRSGQTYIYYATREIEGNRRWVTRHEIEWHKKFILSISCLVLFFIGAPLGAIIRKGGIGMPTVISVIFFVFYFVITMFSEKMVREAILPPEIGMWIATAILSPIGLLLTIKAANDSMNIRPESYNKLKEKLKIKRHRKQIKKVKNT
ncbi:MAG: LptF/LptG family permease [Bacteroidota bacterium]|nr:LptF/LptG family permease [Bacteroidota bacterium]